MEKKYYYSFSDYCKENFGRKLYRVSLDGGFTCPNRDGKIDTRGCIFCDGSGSGDFSIAYEGQRLSKKDLIYNHQEANEGDYIAYFQAFTNTYGPVEKLKRLFTAALEDPLFAGISIATRPDCLDDEIMALLEQLHQTYTDKFIWVELGLQTIHEKTAEWMRRGYSRNVFDTAVNRLHEIGLQVIIHIIIGLPQENEEMLKKTILHLNELHIEGVKLQLLHYLKGTDLGLLYERFPDAFHVLTKEEYVHLVCMCISLLSADTVIHRLTGDGNAELLLAPLWSLDKRSVLNQIRHQLKISNITQGSCLVL